MLAKAQAPGIARKDHYEVRDTKGPVTVPFSTTLRLLRTIPIMAFFFVLSQIG
jgi:hypothetical protein